MSYETENIRAMIPCFEQILSDEVRHVVYTGKWINRWLQDNAGLTVTLEECVAHTNRETWHDVANMANYMATTYFNEEGLATASKTLLPGRWERTV